MARPDTKDLLLTTFVVAGFAVVIPLAGFLEARQTAQAARLEAEELSLKGAKLKGWAFGFEGLLADWYWIRSLQYIGDKLYRAKAKDIDIENLKPLDPKLLYPLLDNAVSLDPKFLAVYSYGANVLPAIDKEDAIAIARKGIRNNPGEWTLYHQLGFIYWKLGDYARAAETYSEGSRIKDAPIWMKSMAARMSSEGGSRDTARAIYRQVFRAAADSRTKESARLRLLALDADDEIDGLNEALSVFKKRNGACATARSQVHGILRTMPPESGRDYRIDGQGNVVDPTGAPYLLDSRQCTASPDYSKSNLPRN